MDTHEIEFLPQAILSDQTLIKQRFKHKNKTLNYQITIKPCLCSIKYIITIKRWKLLAISLEEIITKNTDNKVSS